MESRQQIFSAVFFFMKKIFFLFFILCIPAFASLDEQYFENALNYIHNKKYSSAITEIQKAVSINSNEVGYKIYLGYLNYLRGNYNKAQDLSLSILQTHPDNILCKLILADIFYQNKNWSDAIELYNGINLQSPNLKIVKIRLYELYKYTDEELSHKYYLKALQLLKTDLSLFFPTISNSKINLPNQKNFTIFNKADKKRITDTNDIINISFRSNKDKTENTNIIIQSVQTKAKHEFHISFFKHFDSGFLFAKIVISILIIILYFIIALIKRKKERQNDDVVLDNYRKKFKEE